MQEKPKVRRGINAAVDCEALDTFCMAEEGGETVLWRRNGWWRVKFFNASVYGRREKWAVPISEGERSMRGGSWFSCGGCSGATVTDHYRKPDTFNRGT
jgi:hypothetical protein